MAPGQTNRCIPIAQNKIPNNRIAIEELLNSNGSTASRNPPMAVRTWPGGRNIMAENRVCRVPIAANKTHTLLPHVVRYTTTNPLAPDRFGVTPRDAKPHGRTLDL